MKQKTIMKLKNKGISLFLALCIVFQASPVFAYATGDGEDSIVVEDSGSEILNDEGNEQDSDAQDDKSQDNDENEDANVNNDDSNSNTNEDEDKDARTEDTDEVENNSEQDNTDSDSIESNLLDNNINRNEAQGNVVLQIGEETCFFDFFSEAVKEANESDSSEINIILNDDVYEPADPVAIEIKTSMTLDLNGHTLTMVNNSTYPMVVSTGAFTIGDSSANEGTLSFGDGKYGMRIKKGSANTTIHVKNINITNFTTVGIQASNTNTSNVILDNVHMSGEGNCITSGGGNLTINGGSFESRGVEQATIMLSGTQSPFVRITGGSFSAENYWALYVATGGSDSDTEYLNISDASFVSNSTNAIYLQSNKGVCYIANTHIESTAGPAMEVYKTNSNNVSTWTVNLSDVSLKGATQVIEHNVKSQTYAVINLRGGHYSFDADEYTPFSRSQYINYVDADGEVDSSLVLSPTPDIDEDYEGYYSIVTKDSLSYTNEADQECTYQVTTDLNAIINKTTTTYKDGNGDEDNPIYSEEPWAAFVTAYENALTVDGNANANQQEIDLFTKKLTQAYLALEDDLNQDDLSSLPDGIYSVEVNMYNSSFTGLSMANTAVESNATLVIENGEPTLSVDFKPTHIMGLIGHMTDIYLFKGDTPEDAYANSLKFTNFDTDRVTYTSWYTDDGEGNTTEAKKDDDGALPGTVAIKLPYFDNKGNYNRLYMRIAVDAMTTIGVGDKNVIMYIKYSTLEAQETYATLTLEDGPINLTLSEGDTKSHTIKANKQNLEGYALAWESNNETAVKVDQNGKVTSVSEGTATITVTATAGQDAEYTASDKTTVLKRSIVVNAFDGTAMTSDAQVSGTTAKTSVSGDVLIACDDIEISSNIVSIDATSGESDITKSEVSVAAASITALSNSEKSVALETDVATVTFSPEAMADIQAVETAATLSIEEIDVPSGIEGVYLSAYRIKLVNANSTSITFSSGSAKVTVPGNVSAKYAYYVNNSALAEKIDVVASEDTASFTTSHFSDWVLSEREYQLTASTDDSKTTDNTTTNATTSTFLLDEDGNYLVDIYLWKEALDEASMGDVAFANNRQALVTVKNGKVTNVEIATNPVQVGTYLSAITSLEVLDATSDVEVLEYGDITTEPKGTAYKYIKRAEFGLPSNAQPSSKNEITYADVKFVVPDTPMDAAVGETLPARIRFDWSSASETTATSLEASTKTAKGTSSITGTTVEDIVLEDSVTGIKIETTTDYISSSAKLAVTTITDGTDFEAAKTALSEISDEFSLYKIVLTVNGTETEPEGAVKVLFPSAGKELTIYRINSDGTKTKLTGSVSGQYYVISTSSLGLFAITEGELAEVIPEDVIFTDIINHWAKDYIDLVVERGLFNGTSATTFSPETSMTRGMFITVLGRLAGVDSSASGNSKFVDVSADAYYAPYVAWASNNGIVNGTSDTTFTPDRAISRQEMAVMLYNYAKHADITLNASGAKEFGDAGDISSWAVEAVNALSSAGVINGVSDTQFAPIRTASRADVAALMAKFIVAYNL